ncbi:MAG: DUF2306 domain-containing protein [Nitratireductor sp.]|nr:DUF2306 domain-containing protein [Nitratireductor sp.]
MNLQPLFNASPAIQIHAVSAIVAFVLGGLILFRRKGGSIHRLLGRVWVFLMLMVCATAFFIHEIRLWGDWSPIHLLAVSTPVMLARAIWLARHHRISAHRKTMQGVYLGALVLAGLFTFVPGRIMHSVLVEPLTRHSGIAGPVLGLVFACALSASLLAIWRVKRN